MSDVNREVEWRMGGNCWTVFENSSVYLKQPQNEDFFFFHVWWSHLRTARTGRLKHWLRLIPISHWESVCRAEADCDLTPRDPKGKVTKENQWTVMEAAQASEASASPSGESRSGLFLPCPAVVSYPVPSIWTVCSAPLQASGSCSSSWLIFAPAGAFWNLARPK